MVPIIKKIIEATKLLFLAKQAEAIAGATASGASAGPPPLNLIAIGVGVAAVLAAIAPFVGSFEKGTDFVPFTGLAQLHKGEAVIPAGANRRGSGGGKLSVIVTARDLKFILDEEERITGNSF